MPSLHPTDAAVLAAYFGVMVALGVWMGRGARTLGQYLVGGRRLPWWAILGSIVATETSTVTFLSVPGLAFRTPGGDFRFLQLAFGFLLGRLLVVAFLLPQYFRGRLYTAYEVLDRRFGGAAKQIASLIFLVSRNLADGLRLFLTAIVLEKLWGAPLWWCIGLVGAATIVYTFFGGMKAVVWNDCLQLLIYLGGAAAALLVMLHALPGGWDGFVRFAAERGKLRLLDWRFDWSEPYTLWAGLIGGSLLSFGTHGVDQMMVQRYLCARRRRDAAWAVGLSGAFVLLQFALFLLIGAVLACYCEAFPPPTPFARSDEAFGWFIVRRLPAGWGLTGLLLAAVFAAAMSTLSSSLNSSAASAVQDLCRPRLRGRDSPARLLRLSRRLTLLFGAAQIGVAAAAQQLSTAVVEHVLAIAGFNTGLLLGVFALGVWTREVGQRSALWGLAFGAALVTALHVLTDVAWPWYGAAASAGVFVAGVVHQRLGAVGVSRMEEEANHE